MSKSRHFGNCFQVIKQGFHAPFLVPLRVLPLPSKYCSSSVTNTLVDLVWLHLNSRFTFRHYLGLFWPHYSQVFSPTQAWVPEPWLWRIWVRTDSIKVTIVKQRSNLAEISMGQWAGMWNNGYVDLHLEAKPLSPISEWPTSRYVFRRPNTATSNQLCILTLRSWMGGDERSIMKSLVPAPWCTADPVHRRQVGSHQYRLGVHHRAMRFPGHSL